MGLQALTLPRLGETMESGRLVRWLKQPGDWCERGETLLELETDKTVVELPSLVAGRLVEIVALEGEQVDVGARIALMEVAQVAPDDVPAGVAPTPAAAASPALVPPAAAALPGTACASPAAAQRATPVARRLAAVRGISLDGLRGTGRRGRIEAADVLRAGGAAPAAGEFHPAAPEAGGLAWRHWSARGPVRGTLVLLHGFAGDSQTWAVLGAALARAGHQVLAPDLPSHGASLPDADSIEAMQQPLQRWLDKVCTTPFELVGHSMGAAVAVRLARAAASSPRVTLIAPAGLGLEIDAAFIHGMARVNSVAALGHLLRKLSQRPPVLSAAQMSEMAAALGPRGRLLALAEALAGGGHQRLDIVPDLAALGRRARVLVGLEDRIVAWRQILNLPPVTAVHLLRGAGHMPQWDDPQSVAALFD